MATYVIKCRRRVEGDDFLAKAPELEYPIMVCGYELNRLFILPEGTKTVWLTLSHTPQQYSYKAILKDIWLRLQDSEGEEFTVLTTSAQDHAIRELLGHEIPFYISVHYETEEVDDE